MAKASPDSFTPRRLISMINSTIADRNRHPVGIQVGEGRCNLRHTRRDRNRDGQDIIGQQGRAGGLGRQFAQVIAGHNISAAAARVGMDGLFVRNGDDHHQGDNRERDGEHIAQRAAAGHGQDDHDFLGGIGRGGERIRGKNGQANRFSNRLMRRIGGLERVADQPAPPIFTWHCIDSGFEYPLSLFS